MGKRKASNEQSHGTPLKRGRRVILHKGVGTKLKYNGREVSVLEYPPNGAWMTVSVQGRALKWRKGHYFIQHPFNIKPKLELQELQLRFNEKIWCNVFSFLAGPRSDNPHCRVYRWDRDDLHCDDRYCDDSHCDDSGKGRDLVGVKDAKKLHSILSKVCRRWKSVCNNNMTAIFGRMNVNLDALPTAQVIPHMHWMINHKVAIGALTFYADYGDILFLEKLLNACDTSKLTFMRARIATVDMCSQRKDSYVSHWVDAAYDTYIERVIDLCDKNGFPSLRDTSKALGVPYSSSRPGLRQLHDTIAFNCENISELQVNMDIPATSSTTELWGCLSKALFSLSGIQKLELSAKFLPGLSCTMNWILENLVNLQELSLRSPREFFGPKRIRITSKKLKSLDVSNLPKQNYICGDLPNLKTLKSLGWGGIVPQFTDEWENMVEKDRSDSFLAREVRINDLNIPPECKIHRSSYSCSSWKLEEFCTAKTC